MTAAIEAHELYKFYHRGDAETLALRGVSLRVDPGELVCVVGPSGSGKSTLLACLAGLDDPDGGFATIAGERISRVSETHRAALRARLIGVLMQSGNLFDHLSIHDNVKLVRGLARESRAVAVDAVAALGLGERRHLRAGRLSGGEAARAGLAVALANEPRVLLADEPTGEVDAETEARMLDFLDDYRRGGCAMLVVTHSDQLAARADRVVRLRDGRVVDA